MRDVQTNYLFISFYNLSSILDMKHYLFVFLEKKKQKQVKSLCYIVPAGDFFFLINIMITTA